MTGNLYLDLAISLGGIAFVVGVSALLGGIKTMRVTAAAAAERAAFDEPDFAPGEWLVDIIGRAAVTRAETGELLLAFRLGDHVATRRGGAETFRPVQHGAEIILKLDEPGLGAVTLMTQSDAEAAQWVGRLTAPR